jgi:cytochrome P450
MPNLMQSWAARVCQPSLTIHTYPTFVPWSKKSYAGDQSAPLGHHIEPQEDDWYEGMFIPKDTICIPNVWHMNRDPEIFGKNTEHFDPARYLDASGEIAPGMSRHQGQGHFSYGFGRRNCVGRHMADNSLFINIAVLLWATKLSVRKTRLANFFRWIWMAG